jgi:hypothetical protein
MLLQAFNSPFFGHVRPQALKPGEEQLENRRAVCLAVTRAFPDSSGRILRSQLIPNRLETAGTQPCFTERNAA